MFSHSHKIRWFYGKEKTRPGHTNEVFSRKNSRFSHKITFVIKYGLGKKNHMKEMCFHGQTLSHNFWLCDLIYKNSILMLENDKIRPRKLILETMKNAAQVKCGLGHFLK